MCVCLHVTRKVEERMTWRGLDSRTYKSVRPVATCSCCLRLSAFDVIWDVTCVRVLLMDSRMSMRPEVRGAKFVAGDLLRERLHVFAVRSHGGVAYGALLRIRGNAVLA
jgi:hypothetical protein